MKIAVIDDCMSVRHALQDILEASFDSDEVVINTYSEVPKNPLDLFKYDILFIDEVLQNMNGTEIINKMYEMDADSKFPCIIFITGFPTNMLKKRISKVVKVEDLIYAVLEKPFRMEELYMALYDICPLAYYELKHEYRTATLWESLKAAISSLIFGKNDQTLKFAYT